MRKKLTIILLIIIAGGVFWWWQGENRIKEAQQSYSDVVKAFYRAGNEGNYLQAKGYLSFEARMVYRKPILGVTPRLDDQIRAATRRGTIIRIEVEEGKDYNGYAVVLATLHYTDGSQARDTLQLLKEDGQWRILFSALLLTPPSPF